MLDTSEESESVKTEVLRFGEVSEVRSLAESKKSVNSKSSSTSEPVSVSMSTAEKSMSVEEKRHFAECVGKGNKLTLHYACANNAPLSVIEALIGASRDALSKPDKNGCVPLHFVCFSRHDEKVLLSVLFEFPAATLVSDSF